MQLFNADPIVFDVPDATVVLYEYAFAKAESDTLYSTLKETLNWQQDDITVFGKTYAQPRLTALYANNDVPYSYSNITMRPLPFTKELQYIKDIAEQRGQTLFTSCLCNLYRDGKDSNGWHADNEKELGINPTIASVSFGAERVFKMRHKEHKDLKLNIPLKHGSLLIMSGTTQHHWQHQIPKTAKSIVPRINLTFRKIT